MNAPTQRSISFTEYCNPPKTTSQQKRVKVEDNKPRFFKSKEQINAETTFDSILMPHRPDKPLQGPLGLFVRVYWPYRKSEPKKNRYRPIPHDTKPDLDNWVKMLIDRMKALGYMVDDSQICCLIVTKYWSETGSITIQLEVME